jgi:hypothetical protein
MPTTIMNIGKEKATCAFHRSEFYFENANRLSHLHTQYVLIHRSIVGLIVVSLLLLKILPVSKHI